jgi:alkylation response protein AidB-like acyl-CoA dehydrogenase
MSDLQTMPKTLTAQRLYDALTPDEVVRAGAVEAVLPALREAAAQADQLGQFHRPHVQTFAQAGLLGLIVPTEYGGMGGGLRDLAAATFAMGTACASTALAYFFHCSSASRGLLGLEAIEAGLFSDAEAQVVRAFAEKVLTKMGRERKWLANFASESAKSATSNITISTKAVKVKGGWMLNGVKSFGCASGVADEYLVTAILDGYSTADGLALFFVPRDAAGVRLREEWDAIGMRATANNGIILQDVFVPDDEALTLPGAFVRMMQVSRGTFVGNQVAGTAIYLGVAYAVYDYALGYLMQTTFADTGRPVAESPMHQVLIGEMSAQLEAGTLWLRRQIELEASEPPVQPKSVAVKNWRLAKGEMAEHAFNVCVLALKACGTSNTRNSGVIARGLRDASVGLVQAFPPEKGKLMAAEFITQERQATAEFSISARPTP